MNWILVIIHIATGPAGTVTHVETVPFSGLTDCRAAILSGDFEAGPGVSLTAFCTKDETA